MKSLAELSTRSAWHIMSF